MSRVLQSHPGESNQEKILGPYQGTWCEEIRCICQLDKNKGENQSNTAGCECFLCQLGWAIFKSNTDLLYFVDMVNVFNQMTLNKENNHG